MKKSSNFDQWMKIVIIFLILSLLISIVVLLIKLPLIIEEKEKLNEEYKKLCDKYRFNCKSKRISAENILKISNFIEEREKKSDKYFGRWKVADKAKQSLEEKNCSLLLKINNLNTQSVQKKSDQNTIQKKNENLQKEVNGLREKFASLNKEYGRLCSKFGLKVENKPISAEGLLKIGNFIESRNELSNERVNQWKASQKAKEKLDKDNQMLKIENKALKKENKKLKNQIDKINLCSKTDQREKALSSKTSIVLAPTPKKNITSKEKIDQVVKGYYDSESKNDISIDKDKDKKNSSWWPF